MDDEQKILDISKKIEREKALINAANLMRGQTSNEAVRSKLDTQMREGRRNLEFFEERLRELQMRRVGQGVDNMSIGGSTLNSFRSDETAGDGPGRPAPPPKDGSGYGSFSQQSGAPYGPSDLMPPRGPFPGGPPNSGMPKSRPNFSKLDLIKFDTPYLGPRIQLMLSQVQFKLNVEEQYLKGIEKMVQLYQMEGDRKSKADAAAKRIESTQKIVLLKQALKRYEELHIDMDNDSPDDDSINMPNLRKPLTGQLSVRVMAVKDVDHAPLGRFARSPETFVTLKVEDNIVARTRASRNDRWEAEFHSIFVDKANEVELTVYDKPGEHAMPIGLLWVRISDIVEELRRKRIEAETNAQGWVSADRLGSNNRAPPSQFPMGTQSPQFAGPPGSPGSSQHVQNFVPPPPQHAPVMTQPIDSWFNLEPTGQIQLSLNFVKENKSSRPLDPGLGRKGAVRQRKEEVHEMHGHKFVQRQFYNIMRCALCADFLKYSAGMQCEECKYTCHTKCYTSVVTKCISKSNSESDPDDEKLNHKIPHRFIPFSNLTANWCCHCGYMLPIGSKKNSRRCTECDLTAHAACLHLVPDFCGMSMITANQILDSIRMTKKTRQEKATSLTDRTLRGSKGTTASTGSGSTYPPGTPSYSPSAASNDATEAAKHMYSQQTSPGRPSGPDRTSTTSTTASAAAAAAMSPKQSQQQPIPDFGPGHYGAAGGYGRPNQAGDDLYGASPPQQQPYGQPQQRKYNPADYANIGSYPVQAPVQQRPVQQPVQQQQPQQAPQHQHQMYQQQPQQIQQMQQMQPQQQQQPQPKPQPGPSPADTQIVPSAAGIPAPTKKPLPLANDPGTGMRIGLDHFNFLAVLGKGNFGKVMLAETKKSRKLYAIKVLKKEFIIENDEVESIRSEKRVFLVANRERHPFLTNLHACFQTETRVYFVMEYISGGDLMLHIQRGQFGTKRAQFYAAEVCLALKYFHENGVIYRDLKLDNILLTLDGHIKIADYGLCKEDMWYGSTTSTFCGTPEFMAPEILLDKKYGRAVDWWAFGVLIYQMLLQQSPFRGEDEDEIYDAILADEPLYPIHMPRDSVSILQKLLTREPDQRLGSGPTDAQEIMSQPFFRNINWDDIYHKRVAPPFLPSIKSATDTSNFDSEFTSVTPVLTPVQSGKFPAATSASACDGNGSNGSGGGQNRDDEDGDDGEVEDIDEEGDEGRGRGVVLTDTPNAVVAAIDSTGREFSFKFSVNPFSSVLSQAMQEEFRGFSYTADFE
ncbi:kinase C-like protein [Cladorrhinum sp. PSN259]|nr:kinase C-like protein [Cladorrhinum sp. PSN259]